MYIKYPKEIFENKQMVSQDFLFPCMVFLLKYKSSFNEINSTIGCILQEFNINPIGRNVDKIRQCLSVLQEEGVISLNSELDKINTPLKLYIEDMTPWIAIHDFEIDAIVNLSNNPKASYKIGNLFTAIKQTAHTLNHEINNYSMVTKGFRTLSRWSGIDSNTTISKYVNLLEDSNVLEVKRTTVKKRDGDKELWNTTHEYSFKQIK